MNTLVVYAGKNGSTEEMVRRLEKNLRGEIRTVDLRREKKIDPAEFDRVIIGGPIYAGTLPKLLRRFCDINRETLLQRRLGLFICSLQEEAAEDNFARNFPAELREHAAAEAWLGGRFIAKDHNIFVRKIMEKISGRAGDLDTLRPEQAELLAAKMEEDHR